MNEPCHTEAGPIPIEPASIEYYNPAPPQPAEAESDPALEFQSPPNHLVSAENKRLLAHPPSPGRHSRNCQICRHPECDQIEEDFLLWRPNNCIAHEYHVPEMAIYRHAHAFGLFNLRRERMRLGLDRIIERGAQVDVTADAVIRAIRAQACLTEDNRWIEPAKRVIITTETSGPMPPGAIVAANRSLQQTAPMAQLAPPGVPENN